MAATLTGVIWMSVRVAFTLRGKGFHNWMVRLVTWLSGITGQIRKVATRPKAIY
jgi:hypothetical protein